MRWVLQTNLYEEEGYGRLLRALERRSLPLTTVKVRPFVGDLEPISGDLPAEGELSVVMGSYGLAREAARRGWSPGVFLDNLDFVVQRAQWKTRMLNADAEVFPFAEVPFQREPFFLRPVHDTKAFTGLVLDWGQYEEWRDNLMRLPETADPIHDPLGVNLLDVTTPVMVCSKKDIFNETRLWMVPGIGVMHDSLSSVATASGYKVGTIKRYTPPEEVDRRILEFADECVDIWSPNAAFVLDVADTPEGLKIVEVNNLNSSGFYRGDMGKLVDALEWRFGGGMERQFAALEKLLIGGPE